MHSLHGLCALLAVLMLSCDKPKPVYHEPLDLRFEKDADLDLVKWECPTVIERSRDWRAEGDWSMKMTFHPSADVGIKLRRFNRDWRKYRYVSFNFYNPADSTIIFDVRLRDGRFGEPAGCQKEQIIVRPGRQIIKLDLAALRDPDYNCTLDWRTVWAIDLVLQEVITPFELFVDAIRVEKESKADSSLSAHAGQRNNLKSRSGKQ